MEQPQQRSSSMVFVLVVSAVLMAIATFLTILLISSRSSTTDPPQVAPDQQFRTETIIINDTPVIISINPLLEIMLESEMVVVQPQPQEPVVEPTITPTPTTVPQIPTPVTVTPRPDPVVFRSHTVIASDTLYSIANAYDTSVALMARHGIDADDLVPGNVLAVPVPNPAYCNQGQLAYVVKENDTAFSLAVEYGTTAEAIAQASGLGDNFRIDLTQVICIP